jgi:hypothetical protein
VTRVKDMQGIGTMPRTFLMGRWGVELGVEAALPGPEFEAAVGNGPGDFEHRGFGMGFHASLGHQTDPCRRVG